MTDEARLRTRMLELADDKAAVSRLARTQLNLAVPMTRAERDELRAVQQVLREAAAALAAVSAACGVVGEPEAGRKVCDLPRGHDGYHQQGGVRWLGYYPKEQRIERLREAAQIVVADSQRVTFYGAADRFRDAIDKLAALAAETGEQP